MRLARVATVLLAALALLASAGPLEAAPVGQLTWGVHIALAPTYFDPAETPGLITPFMVLYALHDAVAKPMPGQAMAPSLAESWTQSKDGLAWDFVLRKNVRFHNGEAHEGYWRKVPNLKTVVLRVIPDEATRLAALKRSEVDIAYSITGPLAEELKRSQGLALKPTYMPIDGLFAEQVNETNPRVRQQLLHKIQPLVHERTLAIPVMETAFLNGVGARVDNHGLNTITGFAYSAPYEDLTVRKK